MSVCLLVCLPVCFSLTLCVHLSMRTSISSFLHISFFISSSPTRVAGSLAVTRALGDSYLKIASLRFLSHLQLDMKCLLSLHNARTRFLNDFSSLLFCSTPQYVSYIPYISCKPTINYRAIKSTDRSLIIASGKVNY